MAAAAYTPQRFIDEMKGMADGSKGAISYVDIRRANMIPELFQAHCSIVGAWGVASKDRLLHLRALDWDTTAPINRFPSVTIYQPNIPGANEFAVIAYVGVLNALTGISKNGISVGEKVMGDLDHADNPPKTTYFGQPWGFVLRDTLMFAKNNDDVFNHLNGAHRTAKVHLGFGSL